MDKKQPNVSESDLTEWRDAAITAMDADFVAHEQIAKEPLLVNMKRFMNRNAKDALSSLDADHFFELQLDDRDLKHILLVLIHNHLNTKRYTPTHPHTLVPMCNTTGFRS